EIFETTDFDFETIRARFQQMAFLNKGLRITLTDEREIVEETAYADEIAGETDSETLADAEAEIQADGDETAEATENTVRMVDYLYENGLLDYVTHLNKSKRAELIHDDVIAFEKEDTDVGMSIEVAMQWTTAFSESVHTYANTINTHEGGTHEEGFRGSLTSLVNRDARDKQILREKDDNLTGDDIREGLTAVNSAKLAEPQFEGQTKTKLANSEVRGYVYAVMTEQLGDWLESHPAPARDIIRKAQLAAQARVAATAASPLHSSGTRCKRSDCAPTNPDGPEGSIVEAASAGGAANQGRDPRTQAMLPSRAKILSVERARLDRARGNAEGLAMLP